MAVSGEIGIYQPRPNLATLSGKKDNQDREKEIENKKEKEKETTIKREEDREKQREGGREEPREKKKIKTEKGRGRHSD